MLTVHLWKFTVLFNFCFMFFTGAYRPDIHKQYGSNSALRMGRESDLDSIVSTDTSVLAHDNLALR